MKTLGFEMVDAGFEVAVGRAAPAGGSPVAERLAPPGTVPAVTVQEEGTLHVGAAAEARRFLFPRQVNDLFWEEFSLQASNLRRSGRPLTHSELCFHFLRHLVDGLPGVASEHESLVLALPAPFFEGGDRAEERIGILLGICGDLELRLGALVDSACASLVDPEAAAPNRGAALVVDLGLHAALITLVDVDGTVSRRASARIPGAGWSALTDLARRMLAERFLRQTSFDVTADRRTEQEFYDATLGALAAFTSQPEAWLRVTSAAKERTISVPRDGMIGDLRPLAETIAQGAVELLLRNGRNASNVQVFLSARARHLCGLATAFRSRGALSVAVLTAGAAARGAAVVACERPAVADLAEVPIEAGVKLGDAAGDAAVALRAAFSFHRHGGRRDAVPTHVVLDGIAYVLRSDGVRVSTGANGAAGELAVRVAPAGVGPCEILIEPADGHWHAAVMLGGSRVALPGGETPVAPGDVLEVHGAPGAARLLFVRIAS